MRYDTEAVRANADATLLRYRKEDKARADAEKAKRLAPHTLKVGDVLCASWGWEQTNVDYYEVIAVKPRKVTLQEIGCKTVGEPTSWASDMVVADKGCRIGEPFEKIANGYNQVKFTSYKTAHPDDGKPRHRSWYA